MSMARTPFPMSISNVNDMLICKGVRCCCIYDNQTLKISIFGQYYLHWITRRLFSIHNLSGAGCSKCITFCTFEIWEIWHFCVKVSNTSTNFVVKRCKYKYMRCIQFAFLSDAIHIAHEHWQNAIQCLNALYTKIITYMERFSVLH